MVFIGNKAMGGVCIGESSRGRMEENWGKLACLVVVLLDRIREEGFAHPCPP